MLDITKEQLMTRPYTYFTSEVEACPLNAEAFVNVIFSGHEIGWVSVKDRLPEMDEPVLAWNGNSIQRAFRTKYYDDAIPWIWTHYDYMEWKGVTHWMPLPEPPEA